jgi:hypothetical protein
MAILAPQFESALRNVEPDANDKKNAPKAHKEVREALERDKQLVEWGIDTILIGSYARHVSIRRMRDVDVFSKLPAVPRDLTSTALLAKFLVVLEKEFPKRVEAQDRSICVSFPDFDLTVDAVPARTQGSYWEIPDRPVGGNNWELTNPEKLGDLTTAMNDTHGGTYVPIVKLIRQTRKANLGDQPGGLYFEVLTYHAHARQGVKGSSTAERYCGALRGVVKELHTAISAGLEDPTIPGGKIKTRATRAQLEAAHSTFSTLSTAADAALADDDPCQSAAAFRKILGKNDDQEYVFPMPSHCEDGKGVLIMPGDSHVPAGNRRFGR